MSGQNRAVCIGLVVLALLVLLVPVVRAAQFDRSSVALPGLGAPSARWTAALAHVRTPGEMQEAISEAEALELSVGTRYDPIGVFIVYGSRADLSAFSRSRLITHLEANRALTLLTATSHEATRGAELLAGETTLRNGVLIDGSGVGIAVVDSGVDGTHPNLADNMGGNVKIVCSVPQFVATGLTGFTECLGPKTAVPMPDTDSPSLGGHGTHVAGIIAAAGGPELSYQGAAPGATLYGVSVGTTISVENGLDGLAWVLENHAKVDPPIRVVNNSWGSGPATYRPDDPLYPALWKMQDALVEAGVTVVFAAGNDGGNGGRATTSAQCNNPTPGILCVANYNDANSGTRKGAINPTSSRGAKEDPKTWPDISAPGSTIVSTCRITLPVCWLGEGQQDPPSNSFASMSGTSMAAPHVTGIVAQLVQVNPKLTPAEIENLLEDTAYKFVFGERYGLHRDPFNRDDSSSFDKGHGLVDALTAVEVLLARQRPRNLM